MLITKKNKYVSHKRTSIYERTPKYLQLAKEQRVVIKSGNTELELSKKKNMITEEDLARALTGDELLERVLPRIKAMYEQ